MLTIVAKILKVLNSEASPWQVGWAISLGLLVGLLPFGVLTLLVLLLVCLFTVNLSTFLVVWAFSGSIMMFAGGALESFTWQYAQHPALLSVLAKAEFLQVLHLHHTQVLGAFVLGVALLCPVTWLGAYCVRVYRSRLMNKVQQWRLVQVIKASKIFKLYETLS